MARSGNTRSDEDRDVAIANAVGDAVADDPNFSDAELRTISSFEDALALAEHTFGDVLDATTEIGSGFVRLENKDRLCDETFIILSFSLTEGDFIGDDGFKQHFAAVRVVTKSGGKYWFTDGGTGIYRQLEDLKTRSNRGGGILVNNGLRKSTYEWEDDKGNMQPGVTYYLNV